MKKTILSTGITSLMASSFSNQKNSDILFTNDIGSHFKNRYSSHICFADGDGDGGEGGGQGGQGNQGGDIDFNDPRIKDYVQQQINAEVTGLKNKNTELLGSNQTLKTQLSGYGDMSPEKVQQILSVLQGNEEAQLLADGKFDEVLAKRMDRSTAEFNEKITGLQTDLDKATGDAGKYKGLYERKIIDDKLREIAIKEGVRPEAYEDVLRRAADVFSLAEDGTIEARDKDGNLVKDSKDMLLNPERFLAQLKESSPYYWPESQGAGASGQGRQHGQQQVGDIGKLNDVVGKDGKFDLEAYRAARGKDQSRYNR